MLRLFLAGDLMLGRGIDQILPHPCPPGLFEPWVKDARDYLRLMERRQGPLALPVSPAYPWGFTLKLLSRLKPQLRLANLETAVTARGSPWPGKDIHYRLNTANLAVLQAARPSALTLANNHVLDWGLLGLEDSLAALKKAGIPALGAGEDLAQAQAPAIFPLEQGRLLCFGCALADSGVPQDWAATDSRPGVWRLPSLDTASLAEVTGAIGAWRRPGDRVLLSIHWGGNWGYGIEPAQRNFAHGLVEAGVDLVHGHSSHHPKAMELYQGRLILYGCGDLINDYEGITTGLPYRDDLGLLYFPELAADGRLSALLAVPTRLRRFQLQPASKAESQFLQGIVEGQGLRFRTGAKGWLRLLP
ncbi:CapA family protein [Gallaecimonas kandeliae]|uniref:CapA family protein n=1 Tax=Gallaecimonas kandeliae TaxID=3029055 RepID=UPI002649CFC0|nr:CapA family protein [Gallaecimonas kandeliae]WKE66405.1 CapA family protein [Gallaecimonas kandeliae]